MVQLKFLAQIVISLIGIIVLTGIAGHFMQKIKIPTKWEELWAWENPQMVPKVEEEEEPPVEGCKCDKGPNSNCDLTFDSIENARNFIADAMWDCFVIVGEYGVNPVHETTCCEINIHLLTEGRICERDVTQVLKETERCGLEGPEEQISKPEFVCKGILPISRTDPEAKRLCNTLCADGALCVCPNCPYNELIPGTPQTNNAIWDLIHWDVGTKVLPENTDACKSEGEEECIEGERRVDITYGTCSPLMPGAIRPYQCGGIRVYVD